MGCHLETRCDRRFAIPKRFLPHVQWHLPGSLRRHHSSMEKEANKGNQSDSDEYGEGNSFCLSLYWHWQILSFLPPWMRNTTSPLRWIHKPVNLRYLMEKFLSDLIPRVFRHEFWKHAQNKDLQKTWSCKTQCCWKICCTLWILTIFSRMVRTINWTVLLRSNFRDCSRYLCTD
jgi:hypothetical protein